MPTQEQWRNAVDLQRLLDTLKNGSPLYRVVRPILVHDRNKSGAMCWCGCNSRKARVVKTIPHIDVLIERKTGKRAFRTTENAAQFDAIAESAERIDMPHRCSTAQYHIVRDVRRCLRRGRLRKVYGAFGGNRSGKTTSTEEIEVDLILIMGGPGRIFLNVAPTLEKNTTALKKLVDGDAADRSIVPMIDARLVMSKPARGKIERDGEKVILVDGSEIQFRHGGQDGDNLKSIAAQVIFFDELCAIKKIGNWHVGVNRTMDTQGAIFCSTTPVQGHWAKEEIVNKGRKIAEADDDDDVVYTELNCFDNPWINEEDVQRTINALNDDRLIRRDVYGEWVPEGLALWEYFDAKRHTFTGSYKPEDHGYRNITEKVAKREFRRCRAKTLDYVGGVDFNVRPMSLACVQIVVKEEADENDPANWILWVPHEVVRDGGLLKFCDHLDVGAAQELGLPDKYFEELALGCDATGAQNNETMSKSHGTDRYASTLVGFFEARGHDARPCNYSYSGHPANPGQLDSIALVTKLMREDRILVHATRCKKLIHAFEAQEMQADGRIYKPQGKLEDKMSGPSDALRYIAWMLLARHEPEFSNKVRYANAA